jgi:ribosomal protein L32
MNRKYVLTVAACLGIAAVSMTSAQASCPIAGQYGVKGKMTGASGYYKGEAVIKDEGGNCYVRWLPPNTSSGIGTYVDGTLTVDYLMSGHPGVVRYERTDDGVLEGSFWPKGHPTQILGTETLTPLD